MKVINTYISEKLKIGKSKTPLTLHPKTKNN